MTKTLNAKSKSLFERSSRSILYIAGIFTLIAGCNPRQFRQTTQLAWRYSFRLLEYIASNFANQMVRIPLPVCLVF